MDLGEYQRRAWCYDQHQKQPDRGLTIALLGLGGEVGTLQTTQKKVVRDGDTHLDSRTETVEDLGDILWYVADAATWLGVDMNEVAQINLKKVADRWPASNVPFPEAPKPTVPQPPASPRELRLGAARVFDGEFPAHERFPRRVEVQLAEVPGSAGCVLPIMNQQPCGDKLRDNAYDPDGYRWHDAFHLANLAILGWSPVVRALFGLKRKSNPCVDDVEDGGRAIAIEEGLSAMVFEAAVRAGHYRHSSFVDGEVLRICIRMVRGLEVSACTAMEWEQTILQGNEVWRTIRDHGHGAIICDLNARKIDARPLSPRELRAHAEVALRGHRKSDS
jgi:NTP pyrophosphatase (non-canonical NTP hydrolase)